MISLLRDDYALIILEIGFFMADYFYRHVDNKWCPGFGAA